MPEKDNACYAKAVNRQLQEALLKSERSCKLSILFPLLALEDFENDDHSTYLHTVSNAGREAALILSRCWQKSNRWTSA